MDKTTVNFSPPSTEKSQTKALASTRSSPSIDFSKKFTQAKQELRSSSDHTLPSQSENSSLNNQDILKGNVLDRHKFLANRNIEFGSKSTTHDSSVLVNQDANLNADLHANQNLLLNQTNQSDLLSSSSSSVTKLDKKTQNTDTTSINEPASLITLLQNPLSIQVNLKSDKKNINIDSINRTSPGDSSLNSSDPADVKKNTELITHSLQPIVTNLSDPHLSEMETSKLTVSPLRDDKKDIFTTQESPTFLMLPNSVVTPNHLISNVSSNHELFLTTPKDFADSAASFMVKSSKDGTTSAILKVTPEALGPVTAQITLGKDASSPIMLTLTMNNQAAMDIAKQGIDQLQSNLAQAGLPSAHITIHYDTPVNHASQSSMNSNADSSNRQSSQQRQHQSQSQTQSQTQTQTYLNQTSMNDDGSSWTSVGLFDKKV